METGEANFWIRPHRAASSEDIYLWQTSSFVRTKDGIKI